MRPTGGGGVRFWTSKREFQFDYIIYLLAFYFRFVYVISAVPAVVEGSRNNHKTIDVYFFTVEFYVGNHSLDTYNY